ncbi:MAG: hypothetical protein IPJ34_07880 [Myxococcales bacterium]|nr:hypothetical protein [Myxococcales bacterium]
MSATPGSVGGAGRFAVEGTGFAGVDVALGGRLRLFGEVFYQYSPAIAFASGTVDPRGAGGLVGLRFAL